MAKYFLIAAFAFLGQQLSPPGNTPADQKCVVQGRVTSLQTGEFLKKVSVRLTRRSPQGGATLGYTGEQEYSATSENDGSFRIEGVEPGEYDLSGERSGFLRTEYQAQEPNDSGTVLTLSPAQQLTDLNLRLFPQGVISGTVVDQDGDPADHATVSVLRRSWRSGKLRYISSGGTSANDLGEFRFSDLEPGKYYVNARADQFGVVEEKPPATRQA